MSSLDRGDVLHLDDSAVGGGRVPPHHLRHEIAGDDTVRPQWATGASASTIGTKLNRQRTTAAGTGLVATEVQGADPYILVAVDSSLFTPGAWPSWTPQLDQGVTTNITKTIVYAKYSRSGRTITGSVRVNITAGGTVGSNVTLSLPVTAASSGYSVGSGVFWDDSAAQNYSGAAYLASTTTIGLYADQQGGSLVGTMPNVAVASPDYLTLNFSYEAAS